MSKKDSAQSYSACPLSVVQALYTNINQQDNFRLLVTVKCGFTCCNY